MRAQSRLFADWLSPLGFQPTYGEDRSLFNPESLAQCDLLMVMGLDWSKMTSLEPQAWENPAQARPYEPLIPQHWSSLQPYLQQGKPLFCHHTVLISFDDR